MAFLRMGNHAFDDSKVSHYSVTPETRIVVDGRRGDWHYEPTGDVRVGVDLDGGGSFLLEGEDAKTFLREFEARRGVLATEPEGTDSPKGGMVI